MRNFRTAAVASATALTVLAGGTAVASAAENSVSFANGVYTITNNGVSVQISEAQANSAVKSRLNADQREAFVNAEAADRQKQVTEALSDETNFPITKIDKSVKDEKQVEGSSAFNGFNQEGDRTRGEVLKDLFEGGFENGSSKVGQTTNGREAANAVDLFGKKTAPSNAPQWARIWVELTSVAGIGALVGLVIAGINFASYNGWIQLPQF